MASRRFYQFLYSLHAMPVEIDVAIPIGNTGAIGTITGAGVKAVTRLAAGVIQVQLQDNYSECYCVDSMIQSPVTGAAVNDGSFVSGTLYQITTVGTTNWQNVGLPSGVTAAVGMSFVATGVGGAGTGAAKAVGNSGITKIELAGGPGLELAPIGVGLTGGYLVLQTMNASLVPTDATSGSTIFLKFLLSGSSVKVQGS